MVNFYFNAYQKKGLSKALFNSGNLVFGSLILGQVVSGKFDPFMFLIDLICFAMFFAIAIILLKEERGTI
jgi:hypothetical protein